MLKVIRLPVVWILGHKLQGSRFQHSEVFLVSIGNSLLVHAQAATIMLGSLSLGDGFDGVR
jgi:hypothetical protein